MSQWPSTKARRVLAALLDIGWRVKRPNTSLNADLRGRSFGRAAQAGQPNRQTAQEPMRGASHLILYVADQARSAAFYQAVLGAAPRLNVPGMTEFTLPGGAVLGLMPEVAIERLLGPALPSPSTAHGVPRAELYVVVAEAASFHARALAAGAVELSPLSLRSWGHLAAYSLDPDGHVLVFATDGPASAVQPFAPSDVRLTDNLITPMAWAAQWIAGKK